ncbi:MAG: quinone-dependent dihydroorotate dehydrogenase [Planctomycetes bacterium]|nr:quinone-dependent dihydroorotate dehydrogenase [Planctomycetota bacterium]
MRTSAPIEPAASFLYRGLLRRASFLSEAEAVHARVVALAEAAGRARALREAVGRLFRFRHPALARTVLGIRFSNPVGLAAGFDKDGRLVEIAGSLGFGFLEVGSVSARPWKGNPRPRLFRLPADRALVNRVGLPSEGAEVVAARLASSRREVPVGVNLVKTADPSILGDRAIDDFLDSYRVLAPIADWIVLNVSCPNTADGRTFEDERALAELLAAIEDVSRGFRDNCRPPLLVKFSADLAPEEVERRVELSLARGVRGFVLANSSLARPARLATPEREIERIGRGGLTGKPILDRVLELVGAARRVAGPDAVVVGVGGVMGPADAARLCAAGADLDEVSTGLVYEGPGLPARINRELAKR